LNFRVIRFAVIWPAVVIDGHSIVTPCAYNILDLGLHRIFMVKIPSGDVVYI